MPEAVVNRAKTLLAELEKRPNHGPPTQQLALFGPKADDATQEIEPAPDDAVRVALQQLDPDSMTPREAMAALYALRESLGDVQ